MKYEFTEASKTHMCARVWQIRALHDFDDVVAGQLGGFIEHEGNLSQVGNCWVDNQAIVYGSGRVMCNAWACDESIISEDATLLDDACIFDKVQLKGNCRIKGTVQLCSNIKVGGKVILDGDLRFGSGKELAVYLKDQYDKRRSGN